MARRRMIEVSIAHDKELNRLSDFAQLLYLKVLPHTDDWGRFEGDPEIVKGRVDPLSKRPVAKYEVAMKEIAEAGLWAWYETDKGRKVVQYNADSFERINAFLIKSRKNAEFPPHKDSYRLICSVMPPITHKEQQVISNKQQVESKEQKDTFGEFENVHLTQIEYGKLIEKLGTSERAAEAIGILSAYKESKGKTYKSDYATFGTWVISELTKRENGNGAHQPSNGKGARTSVSADELRRTAAEVQRRVDSRNNTHRGQS